MLDINLIRQNPTLVEENITKRHDSEKIIWLKDLIKKDEQWRSLKQDVDVLRQKRNSLSGVNSKPNPAAIKAAKETAGKIKDKEAEILLQPCYFQGWV